MSIPDIHDPEVFREHISRGSLPLRELEVSSREGDVPIIGPHIASFLHLLVKMLNARRILELGTANGYSTIWLAMALEELEKREQKGGDGDHSSSKGRRSILTVEWDQDMIEEALRNIEFVGYSRFVDQRQGDARKVVEELDDDSFDLVFIDVEKEYYSELLESGIRVLRPGGLLFFDNTAFVTAGDFLNQISGHPDIDPFHFYGFMPDHGPEWDAVTLAVKK
jgi:caffeoyl-CoA O-methyltransferase